MHATVLTGHDAITYAENHGVTLHKHADPTEGAREDVDLYDARQIAAEDPSLIWCDGPSYAVDLAAAHVAALRANVDAMYAGSISFSEFDARQRAMWEAITADAMAETVLSLLRSA